MAFPHITIQATRLELTEELKDRLENKLIALEKFIPEEANCVCDVELEKTTRGQQTGNIYRAEINFMMNGTLFRAESTDATIENAMDGAKNDLKRELRRARGKEKSILRRGGQKLKDMLRF